jgi:hypothetical protein
MNKVYGIPDKDYFFDSWLVIFILIYLFFPLGFFLLLRKIKLHRRNLFTSGKIAITIGISLLLLAFFITMAINNPTLQEIEIDFLAGFSKFIFIFGMIVLTIGTLTRLTARRYQRYIKLVVNEQITDLDIIATKMKSPKTKVTSDLYKLIKERYLENYIIEPKNNKISYYQEIIEEKKQTEDKEKYRRIITCKNCGANNLINDKIGKCRYCNSYIE